MPRTPASLLLLTVFLAALTVSVRAQAPDEPAVLYAGLIKTQGYVVGSALAASGLYRHEQDTTWTHLGWNTPRIVGIAYDPADPDVMFLASGNGGLRTLDGGRTWRLTTDWRVTEVQDVALDPHRPAEVYLATAYGVWRTTDQGATWIEANNGLTKTYTQTIEVDRTQPGRVFAGTEGGLYRSTDGGASWTRVGLADFPVMDLQQSIADPQVWLAGTQHNGLFLSTDGGDTWEAVGDRRMRDAQVYAVAIDPANPQRMAAAGWDTGVYTSRDGGNRWQQHTSSLPVDDFYELIFDANTPGRLLAATVEHGLFASNDLGDTWHYEGLFGTLVFDMIYLYPSP